MSQPSSIPEDVRDRVRFADTVADALLSTFKKRDGDTIRTKGRVTSGDGGGTDYTYHLTGRSGVTTDLGFYIAGSGSDDYLEAQDRSVVRMDRFAVFADPTGLIDQSVAAQAAVDTAAAHGVDVEFQAGYYLASIDANYQASVFPTISGVPGKTFLEAANNNEFALICRRQSGDTSWKTTTIRHINFRATSGDLLKHGLEVNFSDDFVVESCSFYRCGIGLVVNATYNVRSYSCRYTECYVGELITSRVDGHTFNVNGQDVAFTQPYDIYDDGLGNNKTKNSNVSAHYSCDYTNCPISIVYETPDLLYSATFESNWFGGTIQGNGGVWLRAPGTSWARTLPPMQFTNVHWETQANTSYVIDGVTVPTHNIIQEAGTIKIEGSPTAFAHIAQSGGVLSLDDFSYPTGTFDQSGGAFVSCDRILGHNSGVGTNVDVYCNVLAPLTYTPHSADSGISARIPDRIPRYADEISEPGTLIAGADGYNATASGYGGRVAFIYGSGTTLEYIAGNSTFGHFMRFTTTGSGNQGAALITDVPLSVGTERKPYFMSLRIKADADVLVYVSISGFSKALPVTTEWQTFGMVGTPSADHVNVLLFVIGQTALLDVECWQLVSFESDYDLERYQRSKIYTITGALPLGGRETTDLDAPAASRYNIQQLADGDVQVKVTDANGYTKQASLLAGSSWGLQDPNLIFRLDGSNDGASAVYDWSYKLNHAGWNGTGAYGTGPTGESATVSLSLDGTNYLDFSDPFAFSGDFTVSFWWKPTGYTGSKYIVDCFNTGTPSGFSIIGTFTSGTSYTINFVDSAGASNTIGSGTENEWVHIVASQISGTIQGYRNGSKFGSSFSSSMVAAIADFNIGASAAGGADKLVAELYDVRLYHRSFTETELNAELTSIPPDRVGKGPSTLYTENGLLPASRLLDINGKTLSLIDSATSQGIVINSGSSAASWASDGEIALDAGSDIKLMPTGSLRVQTTRNADLNISHASEELTALSGTSATTTNLIPAGARLLGVVARVTTLITSGDGGTDFNIGDSGDSNRYGDSIAFATGTTVDESDYTADPSGTWSASARDVVVTCAASGVEGGETFSAGAIRITAFYETFTAPTS